MCCEEINIRGEEPRAKVRPYTLSGTTQPLPKQKCSNNQGCLAQILADEVLISHEKHPHLVRVTEDELCELKRIKALKTVMYLDEYEFALKVHAREGVDEFTWITGKKSHVRA